MSTHTWVKNGETDGLWACPDDYLPIALARGWEKTEAPPADESHLKDPVPEPKPEPVKKKNTTPSGD